MRLEQYSSAIAATRTASNMTATLDGYAAYLLYDGLSVLYAEGCHAIADHSRTTRCVKCNIYGIGTA